MESPFLKILPVCLSHLSKCHTTSFLEVRSQCTTFCRHNRLSNKCYTITLDYTLELPHSEFSVYLPYIESVTFLKSHSDKRQIFQRHHFCPFVAKDHSSLWKEVTQSDRKQFAKKKASMAKGIRLMSTTCEALHM